MTQGGGQPFIKLSGAPGRASALDVLHSRSGEALAALTGAGRSIRAGADRVAACGVGRNPPLKPPASIDMVGADLNTKRAYCRESRGGRSVFSRQRSSPAHNGALVVLTAVDLESLSVQTIEVDAPKGGNYILTALAASEQKIVLAA